MSTWQDFNLQRAWPGPFESEEIVSEASACQVAELILLPDFKTQDWPSLTQFYSEVDSGFLQFPFSKD